MSWRFHMRFVAGVVQVNAAQINANEVPRLVRRSVEDRRNFEREGHKPAVRRLFHDGHRFEVGVFGQWPVQDAPHAPNLGDVKSPAGEFAILRVGDRGPLPTLFKPGIAWFFRAFFDAAKKGVKAFVETAQHVLQHLRVHAFEPGAFFLEFRQPVLLGEIRNALARLFVGVSALRQRPVPQIAAHRERVFKRRDLPIGGVNTVLVRSRQRRLICLSGFPHTASHLLGAPGPYWPQSTTLTKRCRASHQTSSAETLGAAFSTWWTSMSSRTTIESQTPETSPTRCGDGLDPFLVGSIPARSGQRLLAPNVSTAHQSRLVKPCADIWCT